MLTRRRTHGDAPAATPESGPSLPFDDADFESRLVWILGSPRTGSTWLLRLLIHPLELARTPTALSGRLGGRERKVRRVIPINESLLPRHLTPMTRVSIKGDSQPDAQDFLMNTQWVQNPSYFFSNEYADEWRPWIRAAVLARFRAQAERAAREHRASDYLLVIKEPNGSHGAEFLMSLLPDARMVFLQRDGRDVVDSVIALRSEGGRLEDRGPDLGRPKSRLKFLARAARLWVQQMDAVGSAYRAHAPERRITVRYEDLRADTAAELKRLTEWLALERTDSEIRDAVKAQSFEALPDSQKGVEVGRRAATPGLWRESLSEREQDLAEEIMGEKLRELGYPA